jgi:hypothetical protein
MRLYLHSTAVLRYDWNPEVKISFPPGDPEIGLTCLTVYTVYLSCLFSTATRSLVVLATGFKAIGASARPPVDIKAD